MLTTTKQLESIVAGKSQFDETREYRHSDPDKASSLLLNKWLNKPKQLSLPAAEKGLSDIIVDLSKGLQSTDPTIHKRTLNELYLIKNHAELYLPEDNPFYQILTIMWEAYGNELKEGL